VSTRGCPLLIRAAQLEGKARSESDTLLQQLRAQPGDQFENDVVTKT
jgi:methionyl-tRNA formyltransferase